MGPEGIERGETAEGAGDDGEGAEVTVGEDGGGHPGLHDPPPYLLRQILLLHQNPFIHSTRSGTSRYPRIGFLYFNFV